MPPGPAHMSSQRSGRRARAGWRVTGARDRAIAASWLPSSWTAAAPRFDQRGGVAGGERESVRGPAAGVGVCRHDLLAGRARRERGEGDPGRALPAARAASSSVTASPPLRLLPRSPARSGRAAARRRARRGRRRRSTGGGCSGSPGCRPRSVVGSGATMASQVVQVAGGDAAQDRVDVAGDARADHRLGQVDRGGDGGVGADPGVQQLVGAEAEDVEDRRVELVQRAVAARGEHRVIGALAAQGPVGELGREGGVTAGELAVSEELRQQQVGVSLAVADRREDVVGGAARVGRGADARPGCSPLGLVPARTGRYRRTGDGVCW